MREPRILCDLLQVQAAERPNEPALHQPRGSRGKRTYESFTWREYLSAVEEIAAGLWDLGVRKGDVVAIDSDSHAELYLCDLGVMFSGAASAVVYPTSPPKQKRKMVERAGAKVLFCQDAVSAARLAGAEVEQRVVMRGDAQDTLTLEALRERGAAALEREPDLIERMVGAIEPDDTAIVYLTSGATGDPKIVLSSHAAVLANTMSALKLIQVQEGDCGFAFLPSAHIAQRLVIELAPIAAGVPIWFAESLQTVAEELRTVKPTAMVAPPQVWELVRRRIFENVQREPRWKQWLFHRAIRAGVRRSEIEQSGRSAPVWLRGLTAVYEPLVYAKLRGRVGGRLRLAISGAAPLAEDLAHFWAAVGLRLTEGYGLTEAGVLTFNTPGAERFGTVGRALPGVELRLAEDGELLVRSPFSFTEYLNDPEATRAVLNDGWLSTGDVAAIEADGLVRITGRKKEIIVSSTGKNIFPSTIEALFRSEPIVSNVFLVGDNRPHLTALVTLHPPAARALLGMEELGAMPSSKLGEAPPVRARLERLVRKVNRQLSAAERILGYRVLERDFSMEKGEVTPTMKLRRASILANFEREIEELYADRAG